MIFIDMYFYISLSCLACLSHSLHYLLSVSLHFFLSLMGKRVCRGKCCHEGNTVSCITSALLPDFALHSAYEPLKKPGRNSL